MQTLQTTLDSLETTRIELIEKLTGEANANQREIDRMRQEVKDLNTRRADLTQKFNHVEAKKVAENIPPILESIKACETKAAEFEFKLKNAREGRASELYSLTFKANHELQVHRQQASDDAERAFKAQITQEARDIMQRLASSNPDHARRILLAEFAL